MTSTDVAGTTSIRPPGIEVGGVFHLHGGPVLGPDPEGRSYQTYVSFSDPDGNAWLPQEIKTRLPGWEWQD
jgi:hypothetical protein